MPDSEAVEISRRDVLQVERCRLLWLPHPTLPEDSNTQSDAQAAQQHQISEKPMHQTLLNSSAHQSYEELDLLPIDFEEIEAEDSLAAEKCPAKVLAHGLLELTAIPAPPSDDDEVLQKPNVVLTLGEGVNSFCTLCFPGMNVCIFDDFLTFPAPEDAGIAAGGSSGGICGLIADDGVTALRSIATQLGEFGCRLHWQPRPGARVAAQAIGFTGGAVAAGIDLTVGAFGSGLKAASKALSQSGLIETKEKEVPEVVRKGSAAVRSGTLVAATVAGKFANGIASGAGWAAGKVHDKAQREFHARKFKSKQWHQDVKVVASASIEAGAGVFNSLAWAPYRVAGHAADAGCDLLGHRYGKDAGAVAREGVHSVGNVITLQALVAPTVIAQIAAVKAGNEVAAKMVPPCAGPQGTEDTGTAQAGETQVATVQIDDRTDNDQ